MPHLGVFPVEDRRRGQYELERELRARILRSSKAERLAVTSRAYEELFDKFPDHSVFAQTEEDRQRIGRLHAAMVRPLVRNGGRVLEVGCGRGDVLSELARSGCFCVGIEPSRHMIDMCEPVPGVTVLFGTADRLGFSDEGFDLVFSQQVLEHLHPDDVPGHFAEAHRVLRPGGILAVETPNRVTGPQDISRGFATTADGLHLKEWFLGELVAQFRAAGFVGVRGLLVPPFLARRAGWLHRFFRVPAWMKRVQDGCLGCVPGVGLRTFVGKIVGLDDVFLWGRKSGHVV